MKNINSLDGSLFFKIRLAVLCLLHADVILAASRMTLARPFSNDGGFNVTYRSLGNILTVSKSETEKVFSLSFDDHKFQLLDEDYLNDDSEETIVDDADFDPTVEPTSLSATPPWEKELITGDEVVGFEGIPLGSSSFQELLQSPDPIKRFRSENEYALPVFSDGPDGAAIVKGFMIAKYVELRDDHYIQVMPTKTGERADRLLVLREEERKRRIQQQILEKQQRLQQIKTDNTSYTYFEVALTKKKKMNLLFEPNKVPLTLSAREKYLRPGDELMSVNGQDILKLDLQGAFDVLKDAAFPKKLRWRRLIDLSEDLTIQLGSLQVSGSIKAIHGCLPYRIAKFGEAPICEERPLVDLGYACDPLNAAEHWPPNGDIHLAMALLWRDTTCSFLDKTLRAQNYGSSVAIHVNSQNELMQVEAKNADAVNIPVVQISKKHGQLLQQIVRLATASSTFNGPSDDVKVRIGDTLICGYGTSDADTAAGHDACPTIDPLDVEVQVSAKLARKRAKQLRNVDRFLPSRLLQRNRKEPLLKKRKRKRVKTTADGYATPYGAMHFWNGGEGITFSYAVADFGLEPEKTPQLVMWASDKQNRISDLCHSQGMLKMGQIRKSECMWLIGKRGGCAYTKKAKVVEGIGGCGMIIVNTEDSVARMPFKVDEEAEIKQIKMTSIMISSSAGEKIEAVLDAMSTEPGVFRMVAGEEVNDGAIPLSASERRRRARKKKSRQTAKLEL